MPRKVKPVKFIHSTHHLRRARTVKLKMHVMRAESARSDRAFVACIYMNTGGHDRKSDWTGAPKLRGACGFGRNPRIASAKAFAKAGALTRKRTTGAFAGLK